MATTYIFDGAERLITMTGDLEINVPDMYSRWKQWVKDTDGAKNAMAFDSVGGNTISAAAGTEIPPYIFIKNGWGVRPQESDHTLNVIGGILLRLGGGDPFEDTVGAFTVRVNYQQPVQAISVGLGPLYDGVTNTQAMRAMFDAIMAGDVVPPVSLPGTLEIKKRGSGVNRLTATVDADGTRTVLTEDLD